MRLWKSSIALLAGGMFAIAMPLTAQQGAGQADSGQQHSEQAASQPSHSATSANQRAADLLNTINKSEIDSAKMIQGKTENSHVKEFASTLEKDHQDAQNKLESVASQANLSLSENSAMQKKSEKMEQMLQGQSKERADRAYVRAEARDHQQAIQQLKRLESRVTDPQLKQLVQSDIPVLQKHLDEARSLEKQLGGHNGAAASPASHMGESNGHHPDSGQSHGGQYK